MPRWLGIAAVLVGLTLGVGRCYDGRRDAWERRAEAALALAAERQAVVDSLVHDAEVIRARADSTAREAAENERVLLARIAEVRERHPAVTPGEIARDSLLSEATAAATRWREAYEAEQAVTARLRLALGQAQARGDSVVAVLEDRPGRRPWFLPRLGIGPAAGVCADGRACVQTVGVQLSWEVRL